MKTNKTLAILAAGSLAVLTGCQAIEDKARVEPAEISPFLEHKELLVAQQPSFPFHYFYLNEHAGNYEKIYIAPVNTDYLKKNKNWAELDEKMAKEIGSDVDKVAAFMQQCYKDEFANSKRENHLNLAAEPKGAKTLVLESAIISIVPTKAELTILGTAANLFLPGIGILTGHIAGGTITIECMIKDAETGEMIAMYANTEQDQHAILNFAGMTWYTSAENNIKKEADYTARIFSGGDYSKMRRQLIKIINF